ncbi:MAG: tRNA preQ1(34) S-adenosylmethionine ribosyltransferase-isomerase QueA [Patescibacteria group bacterium]
MEPLLEQFAYTLPDELIARTPLAQRDSSRLFVYNTATDEVTHTTFDRLALFLPKKSLLVMNRTKVVPARVLLRKETGGGVEVLFLLNEGALVPGEIRALVDRRVNPGQKLFFTNGAAILVLRQDEKIFTFGFDFSREELFSLLEGEGVTPLPKYLGSSGLSEEELRIRYQTVFANEAGSVAAPTASLHFTPELLSSLAGKGVDVATLFLHVGLGTFSPFTKEQYDTRTLFREEYTIPMQAKEKIEAAKREGVAIVAVGTTTTRTLESAAVAASGGALLRAGPGSTDIFIRDPYRFVVADHLITNFHLPKSSLMLLVDAFLKDKNAKRSVRELYEVAVDEKYRFFSFGDAMLLC